MQVVKIALYNYQGPTSALAVLHKILLHRIACLKIMAIKYKDMSLAQKNLRQAKVIELYCVLGMVATIDTQAIHFLKMASG